MKILIITLLLISSELYASKEVGNGGDVIVCNDSIQMLDAYEGEVLRGLKYHTPHLPESPEEFLKRVLTQFKKRDFHRAKRYLERLERFSNEVAIVRNIRIPDIPDHGQTIIPVGCKIEQIAFQKYAPHTNEPRYVIKEELWEELDTFNKAFLILHEIVYGEALKEGHLNAINVRYFSSFIMAKNRNLNEYEYVTLLGRMPFSSVTIDGFNFRLLSYSPNNIQNRTVLPNPIKEPIPSIREIQGYIQHDSIANIGDVKIEFISTKKSTPRKAFAAKVDIYSSGLTINSLDHNQIKLSPIKLNQGVIEILDAKEVIFTKLITGFIFRHAIFRIFKDGLIYIARANYINIQKGRIVIQECVELGTGIKCKNTDNLDLVFY